MVLLNLFMNFIAANLIIREKELRRIESIMKIKVKEFGKIIMLRENQISVSFYQIRNR